MSTPDIIDTGLAQIPDSGLRRLIEHIDNGEPLLMNGSVVEVVDGKCLY